MSTMGPTSFRAAVHYKKHKFMSCWYWGV